MVGLVVDATVVFLRLWVLALWPTVWMGALRVLPFVALFALVLVVNEGPFRVVEVFAAGGGPIVVGVEGLVVGVTVVLAVVGLGAMGDSVYGGSMCVGGVGCI